MQQAERPHWIQIPKIYFTFDFIALAEMARLCRDHAADATRTVRAFCVADTSSQTRLVMSCGYEHERDAEAEQPTLGHLPHRP